MRIPKPTNKTFDCIDFKRKAQSDIFEEIKDLGPEEQVAYFRRRAESGPLAAWWQKVKAERNPAE